MERQKTKKKTKKKAAAELKVSNLLGPNHGQSQDQTTWTHTATMWLTSTVTLDHDIRTLYFEPT